MTWWTLCKGHSRPPFSLCMDLTIKIPQLQAQLHLYFRGPFHFLGLSSLST